MTWVDVVDSAVKIGLSAAIGAVAAVAVTLLNRKHTREAEFSKRKRDLIERASIEIQAICSELLAVYVELTLELERIEEKDDHDRAMLENFKKRSAMVPRTYTVRAMLHLVACTQAEDILYQITHFMTRSDLFNKTSKEVSDLGREVAVLNHNIVKELAREYRAAK